YVPWVQKPTPQNKSAINQQEPNVLPLGPMANAAEKPTKIASQPQPGELPPKFRLPRGEV
ncbi:hypothetical protein QSI00_24735, partial [Escherichia coli]|uniref:hypothetical protein n=1 Tax=Escherichia coli TaxID=562 RepID=UPI00256F3B45